MAHMGRVSRTRARLRAWVGRPSLRACAPLGPAQQKNQRSSFYSHFLPPVYILQLEVPLVYFWIKWHHKKQVLSAKTLLRAQWTERDREPLSHQNYRIYYKPATPVPIPVKY